MTPRERVIETLNHREPDMIPLDLGGTESSGITGIAYNRLRKHLGLGTGATQIFDVFQQITKIEDDVRSLIRPDTVPLLFEPEKWKPFSLPDDSHCSIPEKWNPEHDDRGGWIVRDSEGIVCARMPSGGYYFEPACAPLAGVSNVNELHAFDHIIETFDQPFFADESLETLTNRAQRLFMETDDAIVANLQFHLLAAGQQLRGYENFMVDLLLNKDLAHALLAKLCEAYIRRSESYLESVGNSIQVVLLNDDLGIQNGPMLSPDCYREMLWPYQKRLIGSIREKTEAFHPLSFMRVRVPLYTLAYRGGCRCIESRAGFRRRNGHETAQERIRQGYHVLGRGLRHAAGAQKREFDADQG